METIVINKTDKPNSKEYGKSGDRFKLYFNDATDLKDQINDLKDKGLWVDNEQL